MWVQSINLKKTLLFGWILAINLQWAVTFNRAGKFRHTFFRICKTKVIDFHACIHSASYCFEDASRYFPCSAANLATWVLIPKMYFTWNFTFSEIRIIIATVTLCFKEHSFRLVSSFPRMTCSSGARAKRAWTTNSLPKAEWVCDWQLKVNVGTHSLIALKLIWVFPLILPLSKRD